MTPAACFRPVRRGVRLAALAGRRSCFFCAIAVLAFGYFLYGNPGSEAATPSSARGRGALVRFRMALLPFLPATALAGGVLSLCYLTIGAAKLQLGLESERARTIPYGAAMATGALAILPDWIAAF